MGLLEGVIDYFFVLTPSTALDRLPTGRGQFHKTTKPRKGYSPS